MTNIYDEIEIALRDAYADMHREPASRSNFQEMIAGFEKEARSKTTSALQPQLGIFELGLEWLCYVFVMLNEELKREPVNEDARPVWALVGAAVSFGLSIRLLLLNGFDTPAKALLRTYVETLFLCIVLLHDRSLARAFKAAETDEEVRNFWHSSASPKKLHEQLIEIERRIGFDEETVQSMTQWRREEYEILSQSSHLSYPAAAFTVLAPKLGEETTVGMAFMGLATEYSLRTIYYAASATWYFSRMVHAKILGYDSAEALVVLDKENELHQMYVAFRDALSTVATAHWTDPKLAEDG